MGNMGRLQGPKQASNWRLAGRPAHDFGWMWAELGLERPGWQAAVL